MNTEQQERAAFETWARLGYCLDRKPNGETYHYNSTNDAWAVWQARAALAAQPQAIATGAHTNWHAPFGDVVVTTRDGQCVAVTRQDDEGRILAVLWEANPQAAHPVDKYSYVQPVPDHCDRIVWRNNYYHLPTKSLLGVGPLYYVKRIEGQDADHIPISMYGQPAIFWTREGAEKFKAFAEGAGILHEIRELHTPAQPKRKPLTDEQILDEASHFGFIGAREPMLKFVRAIEAAHGIKGV